MLHTWKTAHIMKGILTQVPALNRLRQKRAATSGTDSARYCYSVWLRHLTVLSSHGFSVHHATVGELGPGDSIGIGLAALLSGASSYVGLDIVPFSAKANLRAIFEELVELYARREAIPDHDEFPRVRPRLTSYAFPQHLVSFSDLAGRADAIRRQLSEGLGASALITYRAPWNSPSVIAAGSLDLIFSQAVLEHVDDLDDTYAATAVWLKPGGYASHVIDFAAHNLSPYWNGHRAYTDWQWRLVRGRREFLLNREPVSTHLRLAKKAPFEILEIKSDYGQSGLPSMQLSSRYRALDSEDLRTRGCTLVLRKPNSSQEML